MQMKPVLLVLCLLVVSLCLLPGHASANMGVPMLFVTGPAMLIALFPIIGIEAWIYRQRLHMTTSSSFISAGAANLVSTLIGIPVTWGGLVALQIATGGSSDYGITTPLEKFLAVTWQAPWLIPYYEDLTWMIPTAMLVLLIPFFFVSWGIEYLIIRLMNKSIPHHFIKSVCFKANLITYSLFALYPISLYFWGETWGLV